MATHWFINDRSGIAREDVEDESGGVMLMATHWFINDGSGIAREDVEDESSGVMLMVGDYIPDWVKIPEPLENAGDKLKVIAHEYDTCPKCKVNIVRHLLLERGYFVAACKPGCGFVWYRR